MAFPQMLPMWWPLASETFHRFGSCLKFFPAGERGMGDEGKEGGGGSRNGVEG
jgi:hypothetical protein